MVVQRALNIFLIGLLSLFFINADSAQGGGGCARGCGGGASDQTLTPRKTGATAIGKACAADADCQNGKCVDGLCAAAGKTPPPPDVMLPPSQPPGGGKTPPPPDVTLPPSQPPGGGGVTCDPTLGCGQALTCVDGKQYPTTCGPKNCDKPLGPCPGGGGGNPVCGNGVVEPGEPCDDGNKNAGDGCSATCVIESGFTCSGSPSTCKKESSGGGNCPSGSSKWNEMCWDKDNWGS